MPPAAHDLQHSESDSKPLLEHSESDSRPLLDHAEHSQQPTTAPHEFHSPSYDPEYRDSYTDENFNFYPSGPSDLPGKQEMPTASTAAKLDEPFAVPKAEEYRQPEEYTQPKDYSRQTRYEDMGEYLPLPRSEFFP